MVIHNKKGEIFEEETLRLVLAALGIVILLALAYGLYSGFTSSSSLKRAGIILKDIQSRADNLNDGDIANYLSTGPEEGWYMINFNENVGPLFCKGKPCLCFCNGKTKEDCDDKGICTLSKIKVQQEVINIAESKLSFSNFLYIHKIPYELKIEKSGENFVVKYSSSFLENLLTSSINEVTFEDYLISIVPSCPINKNTFAIKDKFSGKSQDELLKEYFSKLNYPKKSRFVIINLEQGGSLNKLYFYEIISGNVEKLNPLIDLSANIYDSSYFYNSLDLGVDRVSSDIKEICKNTFAVIY
jgi:hypothetical protein